MRKAGWILTKNGILRKTQEWMGALQEEYRDYLQQHPGRLAPEIRHSSPKISKGENYRGLPYLVLDYPRLFEKEAVFAVRTLFWWGHYFSITLQLSGRYKAAAEKNLADAFGNLKKKGFYVCISEDPWEHHFEEDNYIPLERLDKKSFENRVAASPFLKLAQPLPLENWEEAPAWMRKRFGELVGVC